LTGQKICSNVAVLYYSFLGQYQKISLLQKMSVVLMGWNYQLLCLEVHCFVAKTEDRNGGNCDLGATTNF
jgi:hypothetical protein